MIGAKYKAQGNCETGETSETGKTGSEVRDQAIQVPSSKFKVKS